MNVYAIFKFKKNENKNEDNNKVNNDDNYKD